MGENDSPPLFEEGFPWGSERPVSQQARVVCNFAIPDESILHCLRGCFPGVNVSIKQYAWEEGFAALASCLACKCIQIYAMDILSVRCTAASTVWWCTFLIGNVNTREVPSRQIGAWLGQTWLAVVSTLSLSVFLRFSRRREMRKQTDAV